MKPPAAKTQLLKRLEAAGLSLDTLSPADGVEAMLSYYAEERADESTSTRTGTCCCSSGALTTGDAARRSRLASCGS